MSQTNFISYSKHNFMDVIFPQSSESPLRNPTGQNFWIHAVLFVYYFKVAVMQKCNSS